MLKKRFILALGITAVLLSAFAFKGQYAKAQKNVLQFLKTGAIINQENKKQDTASLFANEIFNKNIQTIYTEDDNSENVELKPELKNFVLDFAKTHKFYLVKIQQHHDPHISLIENTLRENNIPVELKYLAFIESNLDNRIVSNAGAAGPWQFMPAAAKAYGLIINSKTDERTDYQKSTQAASEYLNKLFEKYQDWFLVVAAYNCGEGGVDRAIRLANSTDYWKLQKYFPNQSKMHVKKFIATYYTFQGIGNPDAIYENIEEEQDVVAKK